MALKFQANFKVNFLDETEKNKWKKLKVKLTENELIICDKDSKDAIKSNLLSSLVITAYDRSRIIKVSSNEQQMSPYLIFLDKKYYEWIENLKATNEEISLVMKNAMSPDSEDCKQLSPESPHKLSMGKNFISSVMNPQFRTWLKKPSQTSPTEKSKKNGGLTCVSDSESLPTAPAAKYFGISIADSFAQFNNKFPPLIEELLADIEKNGIEVSGVYREGCNIVQLQSFRDLIESGNQIDLNSIPLHVKTSAIKLIFREMVGKIIPHDIVDEFKNSKDQNEKQTKVLDKIAHLDYPNRCTIIRLLKHFKVIDEKSEINLMSFGNLGVVFGPSLVDCNVLDMSVGVEIVKLLVNNREKLFNDHNFMQGMEKPVKKQKNLSASSPDFLSAAYQYRSVIAPSNRKPRSSFNFNIPPNRSSAYEEGEEPQPLLCSSGSADDMTVSSMRDALKIIKQRKMQSGAQNQLKFKIVPGPSNKFSIVVDEGSTLEK